MKEAGMQIKDRQQVLLVVAIGLIALFASERLVISPLVKLWKARNTRIAELRTQVAQGRTLIDREDTIRRRWNALKSAALPANTSAAEQQVFQATDRWASASRVSINAITPQWKQEEGFMLFQCRIDASGGMEALSRFLYEFEQDPMALKLESMEIGARDKEGRQLSLGLLISGLVLGSAVK
jgi:hypothetical protein